MAIKDPSFSIGIEEEYLLVDGTTRDLVREMPQALFDAAQQALQGQVAREFLKSQIEVGTSVHRTSSAAGCIYCSQRIFSPSYLRHSETTNRGRKTNFLK